MWAMVYVMLHLIANLTVMDRAEMSLDLLNKAYPAWEEHYELGGFDCSQMSKFVQEWEEFWGVRTVLEVRTTYEEYKKNLPNAHAYLRFLDYPDKAIECTTLEIVPITRYGKYNVNLLNVSPDEFDWRKSKYLTEISPTK